MFDKVLVTGCNGFIGSHVVSALLQRNYQVRGLIRENSDLSNIKNFDIELVYGDVRYQDDIYEALEGVDAVIHTAAVYRFWIKDPQLFYDTNVGGVTNLLEAGSRRGIDRMVLTSTASLLAHSDNGGLPDSEKQLPSHYKRSKYRAERNALSFDDSSLEVVVASPTVPIGPGDIGPTPTGRMILEFLRGKMKAFLEMKFNLVAVEDVAQGHVLALEEGQPGTRYILGNKNMALSSLLWNLAQITRRPAPRFAIPISIAEGAAKIDEFMEGTLLNRRPQIPLEAVRTSRVDERVDPQPTVDRLGLPQTSIYSALNRAIRWFYDRGYVPEGVN